MGPEWIRRVQTDQEEGCGSHQMGQGGGVLGQNNGDREVKTRQKCETYFCVGGEQRGIVDRLEDRGIDCREGVKK